MLYEFITPSGPITFAAPDDKIAFVCALILGNGKAFCVREDGEKVDTCFLFASEGVLDAAIQETLGSNLSDFMDANCEAVATAFESFAYGGFESRPQYDDALAAITDPDKLAEFKAKHEDRNRSSMSAWVKGAWSYAKKLSSEDGRAGGGGEWRCAPGDRKGDYQVTMHTETYRDSQITILDAQAGEAREGWRAGRYLVLIASPDGIDRGLSGDDLAVLVAAAKQGIDQPAAREPEAQTPCCGARWRYGPLRIQPSLTDFHCARCGRPANRVFDDTGAEIARHKHENQYAH